MRGFLFVFLLFSNRVAMAQPDSVTSDILTTPKFRYGIYQKFSEFKLNTPSITSGFTIKIDSGDFLRYSLYDLRGKKIKNVYGFSDGKSIFINAKVYGQSNYFVPFLMLGQILYFEDNVAKINAYSTQLGLSMYGVAGATVSFFIGQAKANQNPGWVMFFPDNDGNAYMLSRQTMKSILTEYDIELLERYNKEPEKNNYKTLIKYLLEFNQRNKLLEVTEK